MFKVKCKSTTIDEIAAAPLRRYLEYHFGNHIADKQIHDWQKMHGKDFEGDLNFDPSKLLENDKFGISPANTTLTIVYRANGSNGAANAGVNSINNFITNFLHYFDWNRISCLLISFNF